MNAAFALEGRSIAVTGAGRGNGRAIALALAKLGADVHVLEVDSDSAMQTRWLIESAGGQSEVATLDVTAEVETLIPEFRAMMDGLPEILCRDSPPDATISPVCRNCEFFQSGI